MRGFRSFTRGSALLAAAFGTTACPLIFSVQPGETEAGATATVTGTCLGTEQQSARVLYDGAEVQVDAWSNFEVTVTLPDPKPEGLYSVQIVDVPGLPVPFSNFASHRIVAPAAPFQATFGALDTSLGRSVLQTADGGYAAAGFTELDIGANTREMYLVKTDRAGTLQWSATYGAPDANEDAYEVVEIEGGGYFLAGNSGAFAQPSSIFLVKTDDTGAEQWSRVVDDALPDARAFAARQTTDGGYVVAGDAAGAGGSDAYLAKFDAAGAVVWESTHGGAGSDQAQSVVRTADGGYAIAGNTSSFGAGNTDFYLVKTDESGAEEWHATFGNAGYQEARSVEQTADGGYVLAGRTKATLSGQTDVFVVKADAAGVLEWSQTIGGAGCCGLDEGYAVTLAADGGFMVAGFMTGVGGNGMEMWLVKRRADGSSHWSEVVGGPNVQAATAVRQTADGGYVAAGWNDKSLFLVKTDGLDNAPTDADGDGYEGPLGDGADCDDGNPNVNPGVAEFCFDGIDNDCDGDIDTDDGDCAFLLDLDGDGFENDFGDGSDCDDEDPTVNPDAPEDCFDGIDNDCDGDVDGDDGDC